MSNFQPSIENKFVISICGPTAVGKTAVAVEIAQHFNTVVLNADSRQVYKELNIGVAKPSINELNLVEHKLLGHVSVSQLYGAGDFEKDALSEIENVFLKKNILVVCGGSGLYLKALYEGLDDLPNADVKYRELLHELYSKNGILGLQNELKKIDESALRLIDNKNPQRMMRVLEIIQQSGKKYSEVLKSKKNKRSFQFIKIGLNISRENLYNRINNRVHEMINSGLLDEVKLLQKFRNFNALKTVGYSEILDYFDGKLTKPAATEKIKQHTRNYAKRQLTWFRADKQITWFEPTQLNEIIIHIKNIMPRV